MQLDSGFISSQFARIRRCLAFICMTTFATPALAASVEDPMFSLYEEGYGTCDSGDDNALYVEDPADLLTDNGLETIEGLPPKVATGEGNNAISYAVTRRFYDMVRSTLDYFRLAEQGAPSWGNAWLSHAVVNSLYSQVRSSLDYFRLFPSEPMGGVAGIRQTSQNLPVTPPSYSISLQATPGLGRPMSFTARKLALSSVFAGNPINAASGAKTHSEFDYVGGGRFPLVLKRMYSSRLAHINLPDLGAGWTTSYSNFVALNASGTEAVVFREGKFVKFRNSNRAWLPEQGTFTSLRRKTTGGQYVGWEYQTEQDTVETYDANGKLIEIRSPSGLAQTLTRDPSGRLQTLADPAGRTAWFNYTPGGQLSSVTVPGGHVINYQYDGLGNLIAVSKPDGGARQYLYEDQYYPRALTGLVDETGVRSATYAYDMNGRAVSSEHGNGQDRTTIAYQQDGTSIITTSEGATVRRSFQKINGRAKNTGVAISCPGCDTITASYVYNDKGLLESEIDPIGRKTSYMYDSRGLMTSKTIADGTPQAKSVTIKWHPDFRVPIEIRAGSKTYYAKFDSKRNLIERGVTSGSQARKFSYSYTSDGLLSSVDGTRTELSDIYKFSYDGQGNLTSVTNPLGHRSTISSYTAQGWPTTYVDPNGVTIVIDYDAVGRIIRSSSGNNRIDIRYSPSGVLEEIRLPDGRKSTYEYDSARYLVKEFDFRGNFRKYTRNAAGKAIKNEVLDDAGNLIQTASQHFNALGQLIQSRGSADEGLKFTYDRAGRLTQTQNAIGAVNRSKYDVLDRLVESVDPMNGVTSFAYDSMDRLTSLTDPRGLSTTYLYDGLDQVIQVSSPDTGKTSTQYDSAGNVASVTDARGKKIAYLYDSLNRPISVKTEDATALVYEYDSGLGALGLLTKSLYETGHSERRYDIFGRPIEITQHSPGQTNTLKFEYDSIGRPIKVTYPSGNVITYQYSVEGLSSIAVNGGTLISNIAYRAFGGITGWLWGNGSSSSKLFDLDGRPLSYQLGQDTRLLEYDAASRILKVNNTSNSSPSEQFSYDVLNRLTGYVTGSNQQSFSYDLNGNRIQGQVGSSSAIYVYGSGSNRLQKLLTAQASDFYYDLRGNTTYGAGNEMEYDWFGRMAQAQGPRGGFANDFNGFHQRVSKSGWDPTVYFMHDMNGLLVGEYEYGTAKAREHVYLEGAPIASLDNRSVSFVHTDHLGTPRVITKTDNQAIWSWFSDPFGAASPNEDLDGDGVLYTYNLRFAGQYYDRETRLHHNYFRNYNPTLGRYIEGDPIGLAGGMNIYTYANGNPLSSVDRDGLVPMECLPGGKCYPKEMPPTDRIPTPDPKDPRTPRKNPYSCAKFSPSLGACLSCCAGRSPAQYMAEQGTLCQQKCNEAWGISKIDGSSDVCSMQ